MHLTLFIPDLLWPDVDDDAAFEVPGITSLTQMLSLSDRSTVPLPATASWESCLAGLFGFSAAYPPLALMRSRGDGLDEPGIRLCADPISLDFVQQSLVLSPIPAETIASDDMAALLTSLNEEFTGEGRFIAMVNVHNTVHGYFIPDDASATLPDLAACSRLVGRRIDADETRQILSRENLRWLNRVQMCLNQHPVNVAREAAGLPRINSLWPWGAGALSTIPAATFASATGESSVLRGLCLATATPLHAHRRFPTAPGAHLVTVLSLADAVRNDDLEGWQSALTKLDQTWIAPALTALSRRDGGLQSLTLLSPDPHRVQRWTLQRSQRHSPIGWLKRWLGLQPKPPALATLVRSW